MKKFALLCICGAVAAAVLTGCSGSDKLAQSKGVEVYVASREVSEGEVYAKVKEIMDANPNYVEVDRPAKEGDIVNIDVTVIKDGYFGDNSKMYVVGETNIRSQKLVEAAQEALYVGLRTVKPGIRLNEIGKAVQKYTESQGFSVVREYCGHGVGTEFHCEPQVLHYYADDGGVVLKPGMVFTIEPMINAGKKEVRIMGDGWTVKTKDRSHSAQYEHQIVVTETGCEVMTIRDEEIAEGRIQRIMNNL